MESQQTHRRKWSRWDSQSNLKRAATLGIVYVIRRANNTSNNCNIKTNFYHETKDEINKLSTLSFSIFCRLAAHQARCQRLILGRGSQVMTLSPSIRQPPRIEPDHALAPWQSVKMMASVVIGGHRKKSLTLRGVDPETCMIVFKNHWAQVIFLFTPASSSSSLVNQCFASQIKSLLTCFFSCSLSLLSGLA